MEKMCSLVIIGFLQALFCNLAAYSPGNISCEYTAMTEFMHGLAANYSSTAKLISIGRTEEDRDIWTMIVSDSPNKRPLLRPQVKFVGNVNGMSGPACYVLLRLIKHLLEEYKSEASMERKLMENMEIHIIPNLNPDGYARSIPGSCHGKEGRVNANKVNLNTDFPDFMNLDKEDAPIQKETEAIIRWMNMNNFVISLSVISGGKVVVYPFDSVVEEEMPLPSETFTHFTPDDDIFKHLSLKYAQKTGAPEHGWHCPRLERDFPNGIINGAEWMPQSGTMMDYNYVHGTFEITVGILCCRNEDNITILGDTWWRNREGLLHVIHEAEGGIRGQVLDSESYDAIEGAKLSKRRYDFMEEDEEQEALSIPWFTSSYGEFWRPWRPGHYILQVQKEGYQSKLIPVEVHSRQPTFIRVELEKVKPKIAQTSPTTTSRTTTKTSSIGKSVPFNKLGHFMNSTTEQPHSSLATEASNGNVIHELTNIKQHSSLTQLDHSFINLFRGLQFRKSAQGISSPCSTWFSLITLFLLCQIVISFSFQL